MSVVELLGALDENQEYRIKSKDNEAISVQVVTEHNAQVLGIKAVRENLIEIQTNFSWYL